MEEGIELRFGQESPLSDQDLVETVRRTQRDRGPFRGLPPGADEQVIGMAEELPELVPGSPDLNLDNLSNILHQPGGPALACTLSLTPWSKRCRAPALHGSVHRPVDTSGESEPAFSAAGAWRR
ncbi:MAG: hypothetical protein R2810_01125 [Flavobacteriales bacterium]